ncbi:MAG: glutaminase A [Wenzhouxiangellaceae bacterium]|nr:glutaminase A [Wenzhouxiangellaceae bacterium]MBS3822420.1 glutaminase A [Wenzhouxiangellaceae bacterium]
MSDREIQSVLDEALEMFAGVDQGANADYIPALAEVDSDIFGIALVTPNGRVFSAGDMESEVSIQSISKVFTMALVMEEEGVDFAPEGVGVDATGQVFNSIVAIEQYKGSEMNPMVNAGAIATTSRVSGDSRDDIWNRILDFHSRFAGRELEVNEPVYESEAATNQRNQAIGRLMYAYGHIESDPDQATDIYTEQCSINVNSRDLAVMAGTLANGGLNPVSGQTVMSAENVPEVLAIMATAGLYDDAGKWLYRTGLPAKSGVGGGIVAVSPGQFGIAAIAPPLDEAGNSVKSQLAIEYISKKLGGNPYEVEPVEVE